MTAIGLTFDTGALIGLERSHAAIRKVYVTAVARDVPITVPTVVVAEWWRAGKREKERVTLLRSLRVEALHESTARLAGIALGLVRGATTIDAIVMASAAARGDIVYTSDVSDLEALRRGVPAFARVGILHV